jgi:hypothetical protein
MVQYGGLGDSEKATLGTNDCGLLYAALYIDTQSSESCTLFNQVESENHRMVSKQ